MIYQLNITLRNHIKNGIFVFTKVFKNSDITRKLCMIHSQKISCIKIIVYINENEYYNFYKQIVFFFDLTFEILLIKKSKKTFFFNFSARITNLQYL